MEDFTMSIIRDILKRYNIIYDRECKVVYVNQPINVLDFVYLKRMLGVTALEIQDIRVGGARPNE